MKTTNPILLLSLAFLLSSCGGTSVSSSSEMRSIAPSTQEESSNVSEVISQESLQNSSEITETEEKPVKEGYPHIANLDRLKKHEFKGKWIWEAKDVADTHVAFRRKVTLDKDPNKAILHISCESKATVYLNGEVAAIDAVLKRGPSIYDSFYQDIDVTSFLKKGENVLVILVHYWAKSGNASVNSQKGGLIYDLEIDDKTYSSDSSTKVYRYNAYRNERLLKPAGEYPDRKRNTFLSEREIYFDARYEENIESIDYDDSAWKEATIVASPGYLPFGDLYLGDIPGFTYGDIESCEDLDDVLGKEIDNPTTARFALPENMQFLPYFELESKEEGKRITFYTNTYETQNLVSLMDDYVTKKGENTYQQLYWRSGYILYLDLPEGVTLKKVGYRRTEYGAKDEGKFVSDNERLNSLYQKSSNTMHICMRDTFMDCPERERSPYAGDSANQIDECLYAMGEGGWAMVRKTLQTLNGWAKDDGIFQLRWPSTTSNECPMQNLAFIQTVPHYLLHTGDEQTVREVYAILRDYLKIWNLNEDGSVEYRNGSFMWTDWGKGMDEDLMENGWYYWALRSMKGLAETLGENDDLSFYSGRMKRISDAFYPKFKRERGFGSKEDAYDDRGNALAALSGLAKEEDYPLIKDILSEVKEASPYMERFVLEALAYMGEAEACESRMLERYAGMIDYEASTLWEEWSSDPKDGTINHGWAGGPLIVMSKYFAGIRPTSSGYATFEIEPLRLGTGLEAKVATPRGGISLSYGDRALKVSSPSGGTLSLKHVGEPVSVTGEAELLHDGTYSLNGGEVVFTL